MSSMARSMPASARFMAGPRWNGGVASLASVLAWVRKYAASTARTQAKSKAARMADPRSDGRGFAAKRELGGDDIFGVGSGVRCRQVALHAHGQLHLLQVDVAGGRDPVVVVILEVEVRDVGRVGHGRAACDRARECPGTGVVSPGHVLPIVPGGVRGDQDLQGRAGIAAGAGTF